MKVRIIAVNPKYRTLPFYMTAVYDEEIKAYRTGQEKLSKEELEKQPIIIDPVKQYPVRHHQIYDTTVLKDKIILDLALLQPNIAKNARSVVASQHVMYLENNEVEAEARIGKRDGFFEAMIKVRGLSSMSKMKDIGIFLGVNVSQPMSIIQDRVESFCENEPAKVMDYFSGDHENRLFVLKLKHYGILQSRNGYLYDGDVLVGRNILEATTFVQETDHNQLVSKWGLALDTKEGRVKADLSAKAIAEAKKNKVSKTDDTVTDNKKKSGAGLKGPVIAK